MSNFIRHCYVGQEALHTLAYSIWLRLSTGLGFCSKTGSDTFRSVLIDGKKQEPQKKYLIGEFTM